MISQLSRKVICSKRQGNNSTLVQQLSISRFC